jgi:hypothetical protein
MAWLRSSRFSASNRSSRFRSLRLPRPPGSVRGPVPRVRASWRTEEDFLPVDPVDRLARAIPLIDDSPQISCCRLNSPVPLSPPELPCPPKCARTAVRPLNRACTVENDNRRLNTRRACNESNARSGYSIPHRTFTSCNRANHFVSFSVDHDNSDPAEHLDRDRRARKVVLLSGLRARWPNDAKDMTTAPAADTGS